MNFGSVYILLTVIAICLVAIYLVIKCVAIVCEKFYKHIKLVRASYKCGKKIVEENPNIRY